MEKSGLISIVVPVYNVASYLDRCIKSITSQTYTNLQIILIDDGSIDNSGKLCDKYAALDSRIEVIHKTNQGASMARNIGLERCRGDYIGFVDADDWCEPVMFESMLRALTENNVDAVRCNFYRVCHNKTSVFIAKPTIKKLSGREAISECLTHNKKTGYGTVVWNTLFKSELFEAPNSLRFSSNLTVGEDADVLRRLFIRCNSILYLDECYYNYNDDNVHSVTHVSSLQCKLKSIDCLIEFLEANNFSEEEIKHAKKQRDRQLLLIDVFGYVDGRNKNVNANIINDISLFYVLSIFEKSIFSKLKYMIIILIIRMRFPKRIVKMLLNMHS